MKIEINGNTYNVEYLKKSIDLERGAMGRKNIDGCLLFDIGKGNHSFWMKNCLIPLDIIYIYNKKITRIHHNCQPCDEECTERYEGFGDIVLEFNAGEANNFKINDEINFKK